MGEMLYRTSLWQGPFCVALLQKINGVRLQGKLRSLSVCRSRVQLVSAFDVNVHIVQEIHLEVTDLLTPPPSRPISIGLLSSASHKTAVISCGCPLSSAAPPDTTLTLESTNQLICPSYMLISCVPPPAASKSTRTIMPNSTRTVKEARATFQTCKSPDARERVLFYDNWADTYETDASLASYRAPQLAVNFLSENFYGSPEEAVVLDVACGTGLVGKLMFELGFRHFVGVDGSKGMLSKAADSGLYQDLKLALLGTDPLPAQPGTFDVVMIVGALRPGFVPVSVIRELHQAARAGAYVCMTRVNARSEAADQYKVSMENDLRLMEEGGLWTHVATKDMDKYMMDVYRNYSEVENKHFLDGTMYLYRKSPH